MARTQGEIGAAMRRIEDIINKIHCADCLDFMKEMPSNSIDMCLTSPPYWGLRDYGIEQIFGGDKDCKHDFGIIHRRAGDKSGPHGPGSMLGLTKHAQHEVRKGEPTKTCSKCQAWKGQLGLEPTPEMYIEHLTDIFNEVKRVLKKEGLFWLNIGDTYGGSCQGGGDTGLSKERYRKELLTYTDKPQKKLMPKCLLMIPERLSWSLIQNGWTLRNKIPWIKPNCMPSPVKDRFSNKWEYVFYFVKSQRNYFDLDSVREPHKEPLRPNLDKGSATQGGQPGIKIEPREKNSLGKNPGDIWVINTVPCPIKGIHFATFPEELCRKAIIPGCPENGIVLDPFVGIGTACYVAQKLGRKFIGIDIKPEYCDKAENIRLAQGVL